jgi:hypothetical protein
MLRSLTMTPDQIQLEMAREQAIAKHGKRFITLRLIDFGKNRIQGAIVLHAIPYLNSITNITNFHFEERGGPLEFKPDEFKGGFYCRMLDCEHNRKFLASMYETGYWVIEDEKVNAEVGVEAEKIRERMIKVKPINVNKIKTMSDDQLTAEMARIQAESARRTLQKQKAVGLIKESEVIESSEEPEKEEINQSEDTKPAPETPKESKPVQKPSRGRPKLVTVE